MIKVGNKLNVLIVTGEPSGDLHGSYLVEEIKKRLPEVHIKAVGSDRLRGAGAEIILDSTQWSVIGIIEALKKISVLSKALDYLCDLIKKDPPDVMVLIDFGAFNVRLADRLKELQIPMIYYFPPSAWSENIEKAARVGALVTKVAATFPLSAEVYSKAGVDVQFVGHPLLDISQPVLSECEVRKRLGVCPDNRNICIMPGSRIGELKRLLPVMLETATRLKKNNDIEFIIPCASSGVIKELELINSRYGNIAHITEIDAVDCLQIAEIVIVGAGTATLQAALMGVPMVICCRVSLIDELFIRITERGKIPKFFGLPNMILQREVVPELVQREVNKKRLLKEVELYLNSAKKMEQVKEELAKVRKELGEPGVVIRVADMVTSII